MTHSWQIHDTFMKDSQHIMTHHGTSWHIHDTFMTHPWHIHDRERERESQREPERAGESHNSGLKTNKQTNRQTEKQQIDILGSLQEPKISLSFLSSPQYHLHCHLLYICQNGQCQCQCHWWYNLYFHILLRFWMEWFRWIHNFIQNCLYLAPPPVILKWKQWKPEKDAKV